MSVYVISADFEGADGLFKEMREQGITPLSATYLAYIYGCMQGDDADRAYKMLTLMEAEWRFPDARAYENMCAASLCSLPSPRPFCDRHASQAGVLRPPPPHGWPAALHQGDCGRRDLSEQGCRGGGGGDGQAVPQAAEAGRPQPELADAQRAGGQGH
eukprot:6990436-Prymnesium_polylepis.2